MMETNTEPLKKMCIRDRPRSIRSLITAMFAGSAKKCRMFSAPDGPMSSTSVSYTHLDVYKRQQ